MIHKQDNLFTLWCDRVSLFSFFGLIYFLPISTALVETFSSFIITAYFFKRTACFIRDAKRPGSEVSKNSFRQKARLFINSYQPEPNILNIPIGIFFLLNISAIIFSQYPLLSAKEFVCRVFQEGMLFFAFIETVKTKKHIRNFVVIYLVSITLIVTNGLVQYFQGTGFIHGHVLGAKRVMSCFKHPNDFGAYVVVAALFLLGLLLMRRRSSKLKQSESQGDNDFQGWASWPVKSILFLICAASLACLGLTYSRGAWTGLFSGMIILGCQRKRAILIAILMAGIFLYIFVPRLMLTRNVTFFSDDIALDKRTSEEAYRRMTDEEKSKEDSRHIGDRILESIKSFGATGRRGYWKEALAIIHKYPVLGAGLGTYGKIAAKEHENFAEYPHNCFLHMAGEIGLLGLAAFLWIFFVLFKEAGRGLRVIKDAYVTALLAGLTAGLGGFLIHSFFDTNFYSVKLGSLLWTVMGLIVVILHVGKDSEDKPSGSVIK